MRKEDELLADYQCEVQNGSICDYTATQNVFMSEPIEEFKDEQTELTEQILRLQNQLKEAQEEINEYKFGFELTKKEIVKLKETIKAYENPSDKNEDGYTDREIMYRRIARKYMHKCNTCQLKLEKKKIENAWID